MSADEKRLAAVRKLPHTYNDTISFLLRLLDAAQERLLQAEREIADLKNVRELYLQSAKQVLDWFETARAAEERASALAVESFELRSLVSNLADALDEHAMDALGGHHCWKCDLVKRAQDALVSLKGEPRGGEG